MSFIINTIPEKASLSTRPSSSDVAAYGKYMATAASCGECHTPFEKGKFEEAFYMAGGRVFEMPSGTLISANLTPDPETGIGNWSKEAFINKFKMYRDSANAHQKVDFMKEYNTIMPWVMYAGMNDEDLGAIYTYLKTLKPIKKTNVKFTLREAKQ